MFKEINCENLLQDTLISLCDGCVFRGVGVCCFTFLLVVRFRQSFVINIQGVEKVTWHSVFHQRKAVSSDFCATVCVEVNQFLNRPGQALRQHEVEAHRSYGKSTHEDGSVVSLIVKSWYLLYYSLREFSGLCNKSAHISQPLICASSKPSHGIFTNKWVLLLKNFLQHWDVSSSYPP
jgi:hypothetical protein